MQKTILMGAMQQNFDASENAAYDSIRMEEEVNNKQKIDLVEVGSLIMNASLNTFVHCVETLM